jgi:Ca2+-binding EF-hand superfamily protein
MRRTIACAAFVVLAGCAHHIHYGNTAASDRAQRAHAPPPRRLFVSPMGEPFRGDGTMSPTLIWFASADLDHDGAISLAEFRADAMRFFDTLDTDHDGEIGPQEIERYETLILPEIHTGDGGLGRQGGGSGGGGRGGHRGMGGGGMGGRGGGMGGGGMGGGGGGSADATTQERPRQGAARFSYLDLPEPVTAADADLNRGVSREEFLHAADQRFVLLDANRDGRLTPDDFPPIPRGAGGGRRRYGGSGGN